MVFGASLGQQQPHRQPDAGSSTFSDDAYIEVRDLVAHYGEVMAVKGVSFQVARGEQLTLLGPSGCGKTTTLRCIAGLETPTSGEIRIEGQVVFSSRRGINLAAEKRNLSMVFQSYGIWPHMTVFENVAYGLRLRRVPNDQVKRRVQQMLEKVNMRDFAAREAYRLSGGQQQRIALARSLAFSPKALLMDEPLSNLDARLRARMRDELQDIRRELSLTTIYVTHDQEEALALSDRIIVMRDGMIEQEGTPLEIYDRPRNAFVANFVGAANLLRGRLTSEGDASTVVVDLGPTCLICLRPTELPPPGPDGAHLLAVRTVYPQLFRTQPDKPNVWRARIQRRTLLGDTVQYCVAWSGGELQIRSVPIEIFEEGEEVFLHISPKHAVFVADELEGAS